jgi:hypothetical protein
MSVKAVTTTGEAVAEGFFASRPAEKLMTVGAVGFIMSFGGSYFGLQEKVIMIGMASGVVMVMLGFLAAWIRHKADQRMELAMMEIEGRDRRAAGREDDTRIPSIKTKEFCELINRPMTQAEIAALPYKPDDDLKAADAKSRVKLARGVDSGVPLGLVVKLDDGLYIARSHYPPGDQTILEAT